VSACLTRLIRSLALMMLIKNLGRHNDGDGMAAGQASIKAWRGESPAVVLAWRGESFPHTHRWWCSHLGLVPCVLGPRTSWGRTCRATRRLVMRGGELSCEVETCRARRRLIVRIPLVVNWSEMQPTGQRLDVLPVWVLTRVLSPPCHESLP
jgi:hypothetical protein